MRSRRVICLLPFALVGCDERSHPLAPTGSWSAVMAASPQVDISGSWAWREEITTKIPAEVLDFLGLEAEGPITHATCIAAGTLQIEQTGATFTGLATQEATCRTRGGQEFAAFPPFLEIEGTIEGRSLHFQLGTCTYTAVVSLDAGAAVRLRGTGICHDLPPTALLKSTLWEATRP